MDTIDFEYPITFNGQPYVADNNVAVTIDGQVVVLADKPVDPKYGY